MYIATVISKQWCRRFLEFWQWDVLIVPLTRLHSGRLSEIIATEAEEKLTSTFSVEKLTSATFEAESQQMIGGQYSPKPSRKVVLELLRLQKCDYYSWQYIAVVDDERCSPGGFL